MPRIGTLSCEFNGPLLICGWHDRRRALTVAAQAQRASDILDRLRRWSKPNRAPAKACALNDAVRSVDRLLAPEAKATGATVILAMSDTPIYIDADPVELEQVIFSLVRNALDASEAAQVTIRTSVSDGLAVSEVSDDGPGGRADISARIFEPFVTPACILQPIKGRLMRSTA